MPSIAWKQEIATIYSIPSLEETAEAHGALDWTNFDGNVPLESQDQESVSTSFEAHPSYLQLKQLKSKNLRNNCEVRGRNLHKTTTLAIVCNLQEDPEYRSIYYKEPRGPRTEQSDCVEAASITTLWQTWVKNPFPVKPMLESLALNLPSTSVVTETVEAAAQTVQMMVPSLPVTAVQLMESAVPAFPDLLPSVLSHDTGPSSRGMIVRCYLLLISIFSTLRSKLSNLKRAASDFLMTVLVMLLRSRWSRVVDTEGES